MAFFLNGQEKVLGRYGGRDAKGPDTRNSLPALKHAMRAALATHRREPKAMPAPRKDPPLYIERVPSVSIYRGCIHCHQVNEILREEKLKAGAWDRREIWAYPLPENVGIKLDIDKGNVVHSVVRSSAADRAGLRAGDVLVRLNGALVHSFADAQHALHLAPAKGAVAIVWERDGAAMEAGLELSGGWRKTNITWRASVLHMLPSLTVYGADLNSKERKGLGLGEKHLAFRQQNPIHSEARAMGVKEDDIITGIDNQPLEMTVDQFLGYVRQNYLIGDRVVLNIIRKGRRLELPVPLR